MTMETPERGGPERELRDESPNTESSLPPLTRQAVADLMADPAPETKSSSATLWIGVGVVFLLMALAWTAMFFFSSKYRPATVPLETREEAR